MIKQFINRIVFAVENVQTEERTLTRFLSGISKQGSRTILDVGCGYGRNIKLLNSLGHDVLGVEANHTIVDLNNDSGLVCMTVEDFKKTDRMFDVVLMSHVIEHFRPDDLLPFMDHYLDRIKPEGFLIIMTPLGSPYFYDDFDHVKPYSPIGISMVFGGKQQQVQYFAKNKIELLDIWFRRAPFRIVHFRGRFFKGNYLIQLYNLLSAVLFRITFHRFGRCDGWMGLYKKVC